MIIAIGTTRGTPKRCFKFINYLVGMIMVSEKVIFNTNTCLKVRVGVFLVAPKHLPCGTRRRNTSSLNRRLQGLLVSGPWQF